MTRKALSLDHCSFHFTSSLLATLFEPMDCSFTTILMTYKYTHTSTWICCAANGGLFGWHKTMDGMEFSVYEWRQDTVSSNCTQGCGCTGWRQCDSCWCFYNHSFAMCSKYRCLHWQAPSYEKASVASLWNTLPNFIKTCDTLASFKCRLKTHFFRIAYYLQMNIVLYS